MRTVLLSVFCALLSSPAPAAAQDAAPAKSPYTSVIGTIEKVDAAGKALTVKLDKGETTTVKFDERTTFQQIAAGETDLKKATPGVATDVAAGDRIIARVQTADPTGKPARSLYLTKMADLAMRQQKTQDEWKSATNGLVTKVDTSAKKITISSKMPGSPTPREVAVDIAGRVDYQRYNPDSGKYEGGTLDAIKPGDQLRVLGQKNADMSEIKAEAIGSGTFKTIAVQVKSIDTATNTISAIELSGKKPITVALRADTSLKKFSDQAAMMVARQLNPSFQQAGGGRGGAGRGPGGPPSGGPPAGATAASGPPSGAPGMGGEGGRGGGMGGGRGGRNMDIGKIIEQQPAVQMADLKPGDSLIVTGATGNDPSKITATALVAGVEAILRAAPSNGADPLAGSWNMGGEGGGGGGGL